MKTKNIPFEMGYTMLWKTPTYPRDFY